MKQGKGKLAVIALGKRNAGKSNTWYELLGRVIRTGYKKIVINKKDIEVFVRNSSFEESGDEISKNVFVRNASFEEAGDEVEDFFDMDVLPGIIFCSVQYTEKGIRTIEWFKNNGYYLYIHWLNPGYFDNNEYSDHLEFETKFNKYGEFKRQSGKEKKNRIYGIRTFLYSWFVPDGSITSNNILLEKNI